MIKLLVIKLTMICVIINNPPPLVNHVFRSETKKGESPLLEKKGDEAKNPVRKSKKVNPLPHILADQNLWLKCGCYHE